ncbi:MAG: 16S rRNA (uracil(1498)-N(3))-methyltransferase [Clostridia bacterium]|nr:16S rRNA (uracil(1498)-N(3))-methyltransferase [Clostridia bacterium]
MSKFFIPRENVFSDKLIINGEDVKHITKVLRYGVGDEIICCDGMGNDYTARIISCEKEIECEITKKSKAQTESNIHVTIIQGVPKAAKMDYIIQKTTELGVCEIYPCEMSRCVAKIENNKKLDRWQKISREAAKQSGRGIIPTIHSPVNISGAIEILKTADVAFAAYECEDGHYLKPLLKASESPKSVAFIIGPEGGFDKAEIEELIKNGIPTISLGKRILRTETAGEAILAMVMYEIGDING